MISEWDVTSPLPQQGGLKYKVDPLTMISELGVIPLPLQGG